MKNIKAGIYKLNDCAKINIIFGKNGCGKSTALKKITENLHGKKEGLVNYITPERGGVLTYQANLEQSMNSPDYKFNTRQNNQLRDFRQQSIIAFKNLQTSVNSELSNIAKKSRDNGQKGMPLEDYVNHIFDDYIRKINLLLDNIELCLDKGFFKVSTKDGIEVLPDKISSGESELITLAIECLSHNFESVAEKENILFLDEPDVHLHPDLQAKLMHFLKDLVEEGKFIVVIATHSTAIIGALEDYENVSFEFMKKGQVDFNFKKVLNEYKNILPIFGAHPLSNIYCSMPVFLVEGEDDVWIWQKAIRTSNGKLKIFPCATGSINEMLRYEKMVSETIASIYDGDIVMGHSLRDRDETPEGNNLDDYGKYDKIERFMLSCRCAENLFLTDQVLAKLETTWPKMVETISEWLSTSAEHPKYNVMQEFQTSGYNRKDFKGIKEIMNILVGLVTDKPWQIVVGQEIGELVKSKASPNATVENSLANYLSSKLTTWLRR